jgi:hypothetical protein
MAWKWNPGISNYQQDTEPFRTLGRIEALDIVQASIDASKDKVAQWSNLSPEEWNTKMREELKAEYIRQQTFGRGGRDQMASEDWGSVGGQLSNQYRQLRETMLLFPDATEEQIRAWSEQYVAAARQAYERGHTRSQGIPFGALPAMPGDGTTVCVSGCRCTWRFIHLEDRIEAFWGLEPGAEHCVTCLERASNWNPLVIVI